MGGFAVSLLLHPPESDDKMKFIAGRAPNCPEFPRDQWQKVYDAAKTPRENPANIWSNSQIYPAESAEEEDEDEKVNEDDVTTDELGRMYLSPLEGAKPPREGDRHSPYYANMRLEFIN